MGRLWQTQAQSSEWHTGRSRGSYLHISLPEQWGPTWSWHSIHTSVALGTYGPGKRMGQSGERGDMRRLLCINQRSLTQASRTEDAACAFRKPIKWNWQVTCVFRTSFLLLERMTHQIDRLQFPSGNDFYHGIFQWVVSSGTGSLLTLTCKSECEDSKVKKQGWQCLESVKILSVQFPGQNGLRILKWPWLKQNHQTGPIPKNILYLLC